MKREELRRAFDSIGPSREAEKRMLNNILYKLKSKEEKTRPPSASGRLHPRWQ